MNIIYKFIILCLISLNLIAQTKLEDIKKKDFLICKNYNKFEMLENFFLIEKDNIIINSDTKNVFYLDKCLTFTKEQIIYQKSN